VVHGGTKAVLEIHPVIWDECIVILHPTGQQAYAIENDDLQDLPISCSGRVTGRDRMRIIIGGPTRNLESSPAGIHSSVCGRGMEAALDRRGLSIDFESNIRREQER